VIVFGLIKVLLVGSMHLGIVLACCDMKVRNPSELSIYVSLLTAKRGPRRHAGPADRVLLIRIKGLLRLVRH
jgi:hypothetical protein